MFPLLTLNVCRVRALWYALYIFYSNLILKTAQTGNIHASAGSKSYRCQHWPLKAHKSNTSVRGVACVCVCVSLKVSSQLLHATFGPLKAVESSLHQRSHDAAQVHLVSAAVSLAIMLHPQPTQEREKEKKWDIKREVKGKKMNQWRQIGNVWELKNMKQRREAVLIHSTDIYWSGPAI